MGVVIYLLLLQSFIKGVGVGVFLFYTRSGLDLEGGGVCNWFFECTKSKKHVGVCGGILLGVSKRGFSKSTERTKIPEVNIYATSLTILCGFASN